MGVVVGYLVMWSEKKTENKNKATKMKLILLIMLADILQEQPCLLDTFKMGKYRSGSFKDSQQTSILFTIQYDDWILK